MAYRMKGHTLPGIKQRKSSVAKRLEVFKGDVSLGEGEDAVKAGKLAELKKKELQSKGGPESVSIDATDEDKAKARIKADEEHKAMTIPITYTGKDAKARIMSLEDQKEYQETGKLVK
tara:strand:+ start:582 stop:935 length:354 start_codon:yes stop_codon:yes gene_type:complete